MLFVYILGTASVIFSISAFIFNRIYKQNMLIKSAIMFSSQTVFIWKIISLLEENIDVIQCDLYIIEDGLIIMAVTFFFAGIIIYGTEYEMKFVCCSMFANLAACICQVYDVVKSSYVNDNVISLICAVGILTGFTFLFVKAVMNNMNTKLCKAAITANVILNLALSYIDDIRSNITQNGTISSYETVSLIAETVLFCIMLYLPYILYIYGCHKNE